MVSQRTLSCPPLSVDQGYISSTQLPRPPGIQASSFSRLLVHLPPQRVRSWDPAPGFRSGAVARAPVQGQHHHLAVGVMWPIHGFCAYHSFLHSHQSVVMCFGTRHLCFPYANPSLFLVLDFIRTCEPFFVPTTLPVLCSRGHAVAQCPLLPVPIPLLCAPATGPVGYYTCRNPLQKRPFGQKRVWKESLRGKRQTLSPWI